MPIERHICSVGQYIVYGVSRGRRCPPKHILLPFAVKTLTCNVELIQILNRLGHCVSYSMFERIETALCLKKMGLLSERRMILSSNIHPNLPTTLFWDNIDRIEETLSGAGTSDRVNGIAIEPQLIGPQKDLTSKTNIAKSKKRLLPVMNYHYHFTMLVKEWDLHQYR